MNSDPYDSAAWRTFGMLDADESAIFDEAMRHDPVLRGAYLEMDRLSAAIAASTAIPIEPKAGQLDRLKSRLNLGTPRGAYLWLGLSGWAAAAVLTVVLVLDHTGNPGKPEKTAATHGTAPEPPAISPSLKTAAAPAKQTAPSVAKNTGPSANPTTHSPAAIAPAGETATAKVETKRLVQEIEVLRENLEKYQQRDSLLFDEVPGKALPIVMTMLPPGLAEDSALAGNDEHTPITTLLGDAVKLLTARTLAENQSEETANLESVAAADLPLSKDHATAIPIYDPARRTGTIIVSNLPPPDAGKEYNLFVNTATGEKPVYVGSLPESTSTVVDSIDFSLGSDMVLPSGFVLTQDPIDSPATPTSTNTILEGPPASAP